MNVPPETRTALIDRLGADLLFVRKYDFYHCFEELALIKYLYYKESYDECFILVSKAVDRILSGEQHAEYYNSHIKKVCGEIALKTIVNGCYYGYIFPNKDGLVIQELPINYCRSRYKVGDMPAIEFNMRFFDDYFRDVQYRLRVLQMFPEDFQRGYILYLDWL